MNTKNRTVLDWDGIGKSTNEFLLKTLGICLVPDLTQLAQ